MNSFLKRSLTILIVVAMLIGVVPQFSLPVLATEDDFDELSLVGLNVLCLGDSITAGQGLTTDTRWTNVLANKYGWTLINKSQGGISLSSYYYTANGQTDVSIAKKAEVLKTMTTPPDIIIVWGGHNDTNYRGSPLGTWEDTTTNSFKGALKHIAGLAREYAPNAVLYVLTPIWNNEKASILTVPENTTDNNWIFIDAIYEGADMYGWIPINMDLCGINPYHKSEFFIDNIHPNAAGTEKIVEFLSEELASYGAKSQKQTILFNQSDISLEVDEKTTLKAVMTPRSGNSTPIFTWSSSNTSAVTVDSNGAVSAVAHGNATITATADNGISATVKVSVAEGEHTYTATITAPTCTTQGFTTHTCACGESYVDEYVDADGHSYKGITCTACGVKHPNAKNYEGKVISIMGDSISTFKGYVPVADGFNLEHRYAYPSKDVLKVDQTWWMSVINTLGAKLGINESWDGSRVGNTYTTDIPASVVGPNVCMASVTRTSNLGSNGTPDVILVYGGTNDTRFPKFGGFDPKKDYSQVDLESTIWPTFEDAYVAMIMRLQYFYPDAEIIALLPTNSTWYSDETLEITNTSIMQICEYFNVSYIDLRECGITLADLPDGIHPNATGMEYIANAVVEAMLNKDATAGENVVYSVTHKLDGATASLGHYKGISAGKTFQETLTGDHKCISVTMGDVDITKSCFADGKINIPCVTGDIIITIPSHNYVSVTTPPTCTTQGFTTHTCACGESYVDSYIPAENHAFSEWETVREATFDQDGEQMRHCTKCSHVEMQALPLTVVTSGNLGYGTTPTDKIIYTLYSNGTMVLEGEGAIFSCYWDGRTQPFIEYRKQIKHLIIGEGITQTSSGCFAHLTNLETVSFPSTIIKLPNNAFMNSFAQGVTEITIPKSVTSLGSYTFGHYGGDPSAYFTDVIIENPNIIIEDSKAVFNGGAKLDSLTLYSYGIDNNVSAYAEKYGIRYIDLHDYFYGTHGEIDYTITSGVLILSTDGANITIPAYAPWNEHRDSITKIIIEDGITGIAADAFRDYIRLSAVKMHENIKSIGSGAFAVSVGCEQKLTLVFPKYLTYIGEGIFAGRENVHLTVYAGSIAENLDEAGVCLTVKKRFKFLMIGNSYTQDASGCHLTTTSQLFDILQAMLGEDAEITLGAIISGGKGINWHATQAELNSRVYSFSVITSDTGKWASQGSISSADALAWADWDAVSLQAYNPNAATGQESIPYPEQTDPKFYSLETASEYMLDHIAKYAPQADAYFYMHWSQTKSMTFNAALSAYNKISSYLPIVLEYAGEQSGKQFKTIVPVGLSVQNARTTYLALLSYNTDAYDLGNLNLITDAQIGLQRDGGHISFNIGRYIAGLTFAEMIIPEEMRAEGYVLPDIRVTESIGKLPAEYTEIAQKSVHAAVASWKNGKLGEVTEIVGYTEDPAVTAAKQLAEMTIAVCEVSEEAIREKLTAVLAADVVPESITLTGENVCSVTVRFGYTTATAEVQTEKTGHSYKSVVTPPTCIEQGYTTHTCACGESYVDSYIAAKGHTFGAWTQVKAPTCGAEGQDMRTCTVCGAANYRDTRISGDANQILVSDPLPSDYFAGKKLLTIGDSITGGVGLSNPSQEYYGKLVVDALCMTAINKGSSGSGYCSGGAMATNKTLTQANVKNADIITIMLGINDWDWAVKEGYWNGKPGYYDEDQTYYQLGDFECTDTSTFYGALHQWCQEIVRLQQLEGFEDKQFIVITPLITSWNVSMGSAKNWDQSKLNVHGHTLRQYCTAIMEVCAAYGIPVFDANMFSGIYYNSPEDNNVGETGGDGVHINANGHALLAESLIEFLLENYAYEQRTVSDGGHSYDAVVTAPTCTEQGYTTHSCSACVYSYVDAYVAAKGHTYKNGICTACGDKDPAHIAYGDLDGDGVINTTDVVLLRRFIAGGYGVEISEKAADLNSDGILNTTDVVLLRRYIAGGYDVVLPGAV